MSFHSGVSAAAAAAANLPACLPAGLEQAAAVGRQFPSKIYYPLKTVSSLLLF